MARRSLDKSFKVAAVKLALEDGMPASTGSKDLSIHYNSLYHWISEYEEYREGMFPEHGTALIHINMISKNKTRKPGTL